MIRKTILYLSFALCVLGDGQHAVSEQRIKIEHKEQHGHHGEMAHIGPKEPEHHEEYAWSYPSYEFSYSVHDPHTHDQKGQQESREGDVVKGEYWLIEPDGRKRTVTYNADKHSGFNAIVHYSDDHHHIHEHDGKKKDEGKKEEEEGGEEGRGGEEGQGEEERQEENEGGNEENAGEEEADEEGRGGEESRNGEGGIVRWGYGPKWDLDSYKGGRYGYKNNRDEGRDGSRGRVENYGRDVYRKGAEGRKKEEERHDEGLKYDIDSLTIFKNMGSFGRRDDKKKDEGRWRDDRRGVDEERDYGRDREESLLREERRKFDERRGYPSHITPYRGYASRVNPRFYRHSQGKRGINTHH